MMMNCFLRFVSKVAFCKVRFDRAGEDGFVKRLGDIVDLREIDMSLNHKIGVRVLQKLPPNILANLTDFNIDSCTFVKLLEKTDFAFPNLECLKMSSGFGVIEKIVTTSERFPALESVAIVAVRYLDSVENLTFAENAFPTVKNLSIKGYDKDNFEFDVQFAFEIIKNWLQKLRSVKKATINIVSYKLHFLVEQSLHDAFRLIDFGVDLDLTLQNVFNENIVYQLQYKLPGPKHV
uniref:FBD domain-containing protein n=1 Tax=Panagrellus redivivus TaxID=6233 RepID=A0A7E4ZY02_PANRE